MVNYYGLVDVQRKAKIIKNGLRKDGYYSDKLLCRKSITYNSSGIYNRNATVNFDDIEIDGIMEVNPIYVVEKTVVESTNENSRFTCKEEDAEYIINAKELWFNYTIKPDNEVEGIRYKIKSNKPDLFGLDRIFILTRVGEQQ